MCNESENTGQVKLICVRVSHLFLLLQVCDALSVPSIIFVLFFFLCMSERRRLRCSHEPSEPASLHLYTLQCMYCTMHVLPPCSLDVICPQMCSRFPFKRHIDLQIASASINSGSFLSPFKFSHSENYFVASACDMNVLSAGISTASSIIKSLDLSA